MVECENVKLKYSARMTGNQFLYNEFKVIAKLKFEGLSKDEIFEKVYNENLFEYRSTKSIKKHFGAAYERVNYIDKYLWEEVVSEPNEIGRLINFYAILKYDLLFLECMEEMISDKIYTHQHILSNADFNNFFAIKSEQSDVIANFREETLKRLRLAYIEVLSGAGYILKINNSEFELSIPTAAYQISEHLKNINEKRFAKAMVGA